MTQFRTERDSMGEIQVPADALYSAQTQRAVENFPISGIRFNRDFIQALGYVKSTAASVNAPLGGISQKISEYIQRAANEVIEGTLDSQFPIDIFQTGSGTSSNMNANEVIAKRANLLAEAAGEGDIGVHPNDHVNFGQSSNDVVPTAIRIAAAKSIHNKLLPAMQELQKAFLEKGASYAHVVKTGRTHLMDAMPVTIEQEFGGYARQIELGIERLKASMARLVELPQGGTAVGTGINTYPEFGARFAAALADKTGIPFREATNHFEAQATVDAPCEMSGQLKTFACSLMKMANDLRWMNSGPNGGLAEIQLAALQPGSSIMPGKVNPVIEESVCMVAAQVIGNDATISVAAQSGNFELNVMLPVVAHNLLQSIEILANTCTNFARRSVSQLTINEDRIKSLVEKNPILVTAINRQIGYDLAAKVAKTAFKEGRALKEVAKEMTELSEEELAQALDPIKMTRGGFTE